jgi:hypothetical protein
MDRQSMISKHRWGAPPSAALCLAFVVVSCVAPRPVSSSAQCATDSASVNAVRSEAVRVFFDSRYPGFAPFRKKWGVIGDPSALQTVTDPHICSAIAAAIGSPVTGQAKPRRVVVLQLGDLYYAQNADAGDAEFVFDKSIKLLDVFIVPS